MKHFCDFDSTVCYEGSSWEYPRNNLDGLDTFMAPGDSLYIKEHEGAEIASTVILSVQNIYVFGGMPRELTGTSTGESLPVSTTRIVPAEGVVARGMQIFAPYVLVYGIWVDGFRIPSGGAGVFVTISGGQATLNRCAVTNCVTTGLGGDPFGLSGAGIRAEAAVTIESSVVFNCRAGGDGGGIYVSIGVPASINRCRISKNEASGGGFYGVGGGVYGGNITISHSRVTGNKARAVGGMCILPSEIGFSAKSCVVSKNTATEGVGGVLIGGGAIVGCTLIGNRSGSGAGAISTSSAGAVVRNCLAKDNVSESGEAQIVGVGASGSVVDYCAFDDANAYYPAAIGGTHNAFVPILTDPPPKYNKPIDDSDAAIVSGGSASFAAVNTTDIDGHGRKLAAPSIGAYEIGWEFPAEAPAETTADEILAAMDADIDTAFWTDARLNALQTLDTFSTWHGRISTKLDLIPVTFRFTYNEIDDGFFADLSADDGSIDAKGLRFSSGVDILDGLAISELGKLFVVDTLKKGDDPTYEGLGDRFKMVYLPRAYK